MVKNIITFLFILFLGACSSSNPGTNSGDMPSWFLMPPNNEGYIYGVGPTRAKVILDATNIDPNRRTMDLSEQELSLISNYIIDSWWIFTL